MKHERKKVVVLHGWGGTGESSTTVTRIVTHFETQGVECISPTYDYTDPTRTQLQLFNALVYSDLINEGFFVVGISLGGFWSRWLANQYQGTGLFLLNPALSASLTLKKYLGEIGFCERQLMLFKNYQVKYDRPDLVISAVVATDDEIINSITVETIIGKDRCELTYVTGGHRLSDPSVYIDLLDKAYWEFVSRQK